MNFMQILAVLTALLAHQLSGFITHFNDFSEVNDLLNDSLNYHAPQRLRIGILTLPFNEQIRGIAESEFKLAEHHGLDPFTYYSKHSYIASRYVEWLKRRKIEVVVVDVRLPDHKIALILETLNGIVLTGGQNGIYLKKHKIRVDNGISKVYTIQTPNYYELRVAAIMRKVYKINETRPFGVWGTCLGLQSILVAESNFKLLKDKTANYMQASKWQLFDDSPFAKYLDSKGDLKQKIQNKRITFFNHMWGFMIKHYQSFPINGSLSSTTCGDL